MLDKWPNTDRAQRRRLERLFAKKGIDFSTPGFFDDPRFLKAENRDPRFLENYARYVEFNTYEEAELSEARRKTEIAAEAVRKAIAEDGRLGACLDASAMLSRMLDRLHVWNYIAKATLTITFEASIGYPPKYFWVLDEGNFTAAHAFVVAPPFGVVDPTLHYQPYPAAQQQYIPQRVLAAEWSETEWEFADLANNALTEALAFHGTDPRAYLSAMHPQMLEVMGQLKPRLIHTGAVSLKYVIVAVGGTIEPLEGITGYRPGGRTALQLFETEVLPNVS